MLPPQPGSSALLHWCSALGAQGQSQLFPKQPPDDAHRQGYNLAKHSAGALEGAGPHWLISQSCTHQACTCHSNEGTCTRRGGSHWHGMCVQGPLHPTHALQGRDWGPGGWLHLHWPVPIAGSEQRAPLLISAGPGPARQPVQREGCTGAWGARSPAQAPVGLHTRGYGCTQTLPVLGCLSICPCPCACQGTGSSSAGLPPSPARCNPDRQ